MISIADFMQIVADTFFNGSVDLAGLSIFAIVLALTFTFSKNAFVSLVLSSPVTLIFSSMGLLSESVTIILVIITVVALAYTSRTVWSR